MGEREKDKKLVTLIVLFFTEVVNPKLEKQATKLELKQMECVFVCERSDSWHRITKEPSSSVRVIMCKTLNSTRTHNTQWSARERLRNKRTKHNK